MTEVRREGHAALHGSSTADILASTYQGAGALGAQIREMTKGVAGAVSGASGTMPDQTRYEMRITGSTVNISDTLTVPDGHLWDLSIRAVAGATATFTGSSAVPSRKPTDNQLRVTVTELGGETLRDFRAAPGVAVQTSPDVGVGIEGTFPFQVRASCTVSLTFVPITDPDITFTLSAVDWASRISDTEPGVLVVATWRRALGPGEDI